MEEIMLMMVVMGLNMTDTRHSLLTISQRLVLIMYFIPYFFLFNSVKLSSSLTPKQFPVMIKLL